jgi:maleate isomerase
LNGWRLKLGVAVPSANAVMEPEFNKMAPLGVSVHFARMWLKADTEEQINGLINYTKEAAELLSHAGVDLVAFGCTTGSLIQGMGYDARIINIIEKATGIPATTTSTAVISALQKLGVKKLTVVAPYPDWLMQKVKLFLDNNGFSVVSLKGLGCVEGPEIMSTPVEAVYKLVKETVVGETDGIFISCTGFRSIEVLECIEDDLGLPTISSNQATFWDMLRKGGLKAKIPGYGALLREY